MNKVFCLLVFCLSALFISGQTPVGIEDIVLRTKDGSLHGLDAKVAKLNGIILGEIGMSCNTVSDSHSDMLTKLFYMGVMGKEGRFSYAYIGGNSIRQPFGSDPWMKFSPDGDIEIKKSLLVNGPLAVGNVARINFSENFIKFDLVSMPAVIPDTCYIRHYGNFLFVGSDRNTRSLFLAKNGSVGVGTTVVGSCKLAVEGKVGAREVVVSAPGTAWPDYVFNSNYKLGSLEEVEQYVNKEKHLPDVPSAEVVAKDGVNLGEMNAILLRKVEELTLHLIRQEKEIKELKKQFKRRR